MTSHEELFATFYNQGKILVRDMDDSTLREHRNTLSHIAFEAKAKLVAADDELRERNVKNKNRTWLVTDDQSMNNPNVTDAINVVKIRKERMTKMDKMRVQLLSAGIESAIVDEMIRKMERRVTESTLKTVSFNTTKSTNESTNESNNKSATKSISAELLVSKVDTPKPFNLADLKFGS